MSDTPPNSVSYSEDRDRFADRLFGDALGAFNVFAVYIGDRLGFYQALAEHPDLTAQEMAERTGVLERYAREWLEQQASACVLHVEQGANGNTERRFSLSPGRAEVLVDRDSLSYMAPLTRLIAGAV
jgi:hypothetical protein